MYCFLGVTLWAFLFGFEKYYREEEMESPYVFHMQFSFSLSQGIHARTSRAHPWPPPTPPCRPPPNALFTKTVKDRLGYSYGGQLNSAGSWAAKASLPFGRSDLGAVVCCTGDASPLFYLFGGVASNNTVATELLSYDPVFERVDTNFTSMPKPKYRFGYAAALKSFFSFGGVSVYDGAPTNDVLEFSTTAKNWTTLTASPMPTARSDLACVAVGLQIYCIGGYDAQFKPLSTVEVFDSQAKKWTAGEASMPTARGDVTATAVGDKIYVTGGWNQQFLSTVEVYDTTAKKWSTVRSLLKVIRRRLFGRCFRFLPCFFFLL